MRRGILVAGMMALLAIPAAAQQGGGPGRMGPPQSGQGMFQGITLTADQQKKVDSIWTAYAPVRDEMRGKMQPGQMPDSATRVQMMGMRKAHQGDMRTVLTGEQRKVFDKNVAEMETRGMGMVQQRVEDESGHQQPQTRQREGPMKGFVGNIEDRTVKNRDYRRVIYTGAHMQLVVMSLAPGEEIGEEVHKDVDQFFRVEEGNGEVWIDGKMTAIEGAFGIVAPAGAKHNIKNTGAKPLKLYTLYAPPQHEDGSVMKTKAEADASKEHFTGKTTE